MGLKSCSFLRVTFGASEKALHPPNDYRVRYLEGKMEGCSALRSLARDSVFTRTSPLLHLLVTRTPGSERVLFYISSNTQSSE